MKILYLDCSAGISGDMMLAALIDAGCDFNMVAGELAKLGLNGYSLRVEKAMRCGIACTRFVVDVDGHQPERKFSDIAGLISGSSLSPAVKEDAAGIFTELGRAEAAVHGVDISEIHFHEIGAVDSIIDICGTAIAMNAMGFDEIYNSAVNTGSGHVKTAHGILPVPAPATAKLLEGNTVYSSGAPFELATPTGAAILRYYSRGCSAMKEMKLYATGYGAGSRELDFPNALRLFAGVASVLSGTEDVTELETNIDDMNPEFFTSLYELLQSEGALDVSVIPVFMKKNRPGHILKVLVRQGDEKRFMKLIFHETTTSGIRIKPVRRVALVRRHEDVSTGYGVVRVKVHEYEGEVTSVSPEYSDCRECALRNNVPVKLVYNAAISGYYRAF